MSAPCPGCGSTGVGHRIACVTYNDACKKAIAEAYKLLDSSEKLLRKVVGPKGTIIRDEHGVTAFMEPIPISDAMFEFLTGRKPTKRN